MPFAVSFEPLRPLQRRIHCWGPQAGHEGLQFSHRRTHDIHLLLTELLYTRERSHIRLGERFNVLAARFEDCGYVDARQLELRDELRIFRKHIAGIDCCHDDSVKVVAKKSYSLSGNDAG
jgi:hypothetical protein